VPGSPHQRGSCCLFSKSKSKKDGQGEEEKTLGTFRQAELKTGSASSQTAEGEKWVEGEEEKRIAMLDRIHIQTLMH